MIRIPAYANNLPWRQRVSLGWRSIWGRVQGKLETLFARLLLWRYGAGVGHGLKVSGRLRCMNKGTLSVGDRVWINSGPDNNFVGGDRRTNFWVAPGASLCLENDVALSNTTVVAWCSVQILQGTYIGGGCDIYDNDFHQLDPKDRQLNRGEVQAAPVVIGPWAFVGGHTIVLKGVTIGEGAVVGAGSVVTRDVPPLQLWAGNPARFIKVLPSCPSKQTTLG